MTSWERPASAMARLTRGAVTEAALFWALLALASSAAAVAAAAVTSACLTAWMAGRDVGKRLHPCCRS